MLPFAPRFLGKASLVNPPYPEKTKNLLSAGKLGVVTPKINAAIENNGERLEVKAMLDSGSDFMVTIQNPDVIRILGLRPFKTKTAYNHDGPITFGVAMIESLSIGSCQVSDIEALLNPRPDDERSDDIIIGEPFLKATNGNLEFTEDGFKFSCKSKVSWLALGSLGVIGAGVAAYFLLKP